MSVSNFSGVSIGGPVVTATTQNGVVTGLEAGGCCNCPARSGRQAHFTCREKLCSTCPRQERTVLGHARVRNGWLWWPRRQHQWRHHGQPDNRQHYRIGYVRAVRHERRACHCHDSKRIFQCGRAVGYFVRERARWKAQDGLRNGRDFGYLLFARRNNFFVRHSCRTELTMRALNLILKGFEQ